MRGRSRYAKTEHKFHLISLLRIFVLHPVIKSRNKTNNNTTESHTYTYHDDQYNRSRSILLISENPTQHPVDNSSNVPFSVPSSFLPWRTNLGHYAYNFPDSCRGPWVGSICTRSVWLSSDRYWSYPPPPCCCCFARSVPLDSTSRIDEHKINDTRKSDPNLACLLVSHFVESDLLRRISKVWWPNYQVSK